MKGEARGMVNLPALRTFLSIRLIDPEAACYSIDKASERGFPQSPQSKVYMCIIFVAALVRILM